jgi:hypothetical protein
MMRFAVSSTLDAIEARLTLDPALARGVVELAEAVRLVDLDSDAVKPASLLRVGHLVDALARHLGEDGVAVYAVVARSLLSDLDLTSNERMVVRRWADDGLVEVLDEPGDRVLEVAELVGAPVISRSTFDEWSDRYPWLPNGLLVPGAVAHAEPTGLSARGHSLPGLAGTRALTRLWRCPEPECTGFGAPTGGQPPPRLVAGAPTCPRHGNRLANAGPRPVARVLAARVDGTVRGRFVVREGEPVLVGRSPETGFALVDWLGEEAMRWVSRTHLRVELRGDALVVVDTSTNGTTVHTRGGPVRLAAGQAYGLAADDVVELYQHVELSRPGRLRGGTVQGSVMAEAPTIAMRRPGQP